MMEYSFSTADGTISSIVKPSVEANNFEIKPSIIQIIRSSVQFYGLPDEDPNKHLMNFLEICDTFRFNSVSNDAVRLRIFPFSLCDTAKDWLQSLPAGSITTWAALTQKFLAKYFSPAKTAKMLNDITSFVQLDRKSLYDAWERFKSMLRKCSHHELPVWRQVQTFYNGVTLANRATIDAAAGGTIMKKLPLEAFNIIDEIATNLYSYGQEKADKRPAGIHSIDAISALSAQMTALTQIVNNLGRQCGMVHQWDLVVHVQGPPRHHQPRQVELPQEKKSNIEDVLSKFITAADTRFQSQDARLQSQEASIRNIEVQIGQLVSIVSGRKEGQLPSDTEKNSREQVNAIFVRNERAIGDEPLKEQVEESQAKKEEESQEEIKGSHLKLNLDMPSSAKFLKEVLSNKRKWEEGETVKLNEECSTILQNKLPPKFKDPGSFYIPCTIGNF
ncbi:UNVERIFIED_CONTAM: hypothetical protein Slati_3041500 [Sesamum latifolium]|uniref:Retrotransposon gag domain-containing protein n=1 Tax=Sesamum latifolium TaxID=2727402 RepID=A0AAW2VGR1_9LAMI